MITSDQVSQAVEKALSEAVVGEGFAASAVRTRRGPGPAGTTVVTAAAEGAYPGTGVRTAIIDGDAVFGRDFPHRLADLARARGWLESPPDAATLASLANYVHFGGLLALDNDAQPTLTRDQGGLVLELVRRTFPSGARERIRIAVPPGGPEEIAVSSGEPPAPPAPTPIDKVAGLLRVVAAGAPTAILAELRAFPPPQTARELQAVAAAAASTNDTVAATALLKIGESDGAVAALREAFTALPPQRRQKLIEIARDTQSDAFANRVAAPNA